MAETQLVGVAALRRDWTRFCARDGALDKALHDAHQHALEPVAAAARGAVPHESGTLAGSVSAPIDWEGEPTGAQVGYVGVEYAGPVDMGGYPEGRDYLSGGRYMFPAAHGLDTAAAALDATGIQGALDRFPWTNQTTNAEAVHD